MNDALNPHDIDAILRQQGIDQRPLARKLYDGVAPMIPAIQQLPNVIENINGKLDPRLHQHIPHYTET